MLKKKRLELAYRGAGGEIKESDAGSDQPSNLGDHPKAAIDDRVKSGHREKA
jgi:hypothetical protein